MEGIDPAAAAKPVPPVAAVDEMLQERPGLLVRAVVLCLVGGALLWLTGWLAFGGPQADTQGWDTVWGLTGISFLFAFVPLPGVTSALLLTLRHDWTLGLLGVLGAALGGTLAAGLLLALGHSGRAYLRRRATHSQRARRLLARSERVARKWTYAGILVLLLPQFIPRAVTLYAAQVVRLRAVPFLGAVLLGTFLRNLLMLLGFRLIP